MKKLNKKASLLRSDTGLTIPEEDEIRKSDELQRIFTNDANHDHESGAETPPRGDRVEADRKVMRKSDSSVAVSDCGSDAESEDSEVHQLQEPLRASQDERVIVRRSQWDMEQEAR